MYYIMYYILAFFVRWPAHAYDFNANEPLRLPLRALGIMKS